MNKQKVSVIVPVYKAEPYIERCVRSLFGQTLGEIEFIFVDDCTPDNSFDIVHKVLSEFPGRMDSVKFLRNEQNKGVSISRQLGVDEAEGEYVIHCDPDDWVELDGYEKAYSAAVNQGVDILIFGYRTTMDDVQVQINLPRDRHDLMSLITRGKFDNYLWNRLIRTDFIRNSEIKFNPNLNLWEDQAYLTQLMFLTDKVAVLDETLYNYFCDRTGSISNGKSLNKVMSKVNAVVEIEDFLRNRGLIAAFSKDMDFWKASVKYDLIRLDVGNSANMWNKVFPDVSDKIWTMPFPFSRKIICMLARLRLGFIAKMIQKLSKKK